MACNGWKARGESNGALVAIEPKSGEELALVSRPSYDPNLFIVASVTRTMGRCAMSQIGPREIAQQPVSIRRAPASSPSWWWLALNAA
jgi:cell division protein FtsI/penicillin-binding protein 2